MLSQYQKVCAIMAGEFNSFNEGYVGTDHPGNLCTVTKESLITVSTEKEAMQG